VCVMCVYGVVQGFGVTTEKLSDTVSVTVEEDEYQLTHGAVVLAAIASCTNATNASVMLAAGECHCLCHLVV
jgi:aconitate hydratase